MTGKIFSLDKNTKTGKGSHFPLMYKKMVTLGGILWVWVVPEEKGKPPSIHVSIHDSWIFQECRDAEGSLNQTFIKSNL